MAPSVSRRVILVNGVVQGVGFRPFVYRLARKYGLQGLVKNQTGSLFIDVQGPAVLLDDFFHELTARPPALAKVIDVQWHPRLPEGDQKDFCIADSQTAGAEPTFVSPDIATCEDCLAELFDPGDRRYRYPFVNCTHCGPRFTILTALPYDRTRTTMDSFAMCPQCRAEYEDPLNRRFHAQPIACPVCGPQLQLFTAEGESIAALDVIAFAAERLRAGKILALKGLGGFHLACDATNETAVRELRRRKHRDEKPFALMAADVTDVNAEEGRLLLSRERPIVLLRKKASDRIAPSVAPGNSALGMMLPYTPLHHLLLRQMQGVPLVMTSGNQSDEPMVYRDEELLPSLGKVADVFLTHNRPIHFRCDDSVVCTVGGMPILMRRSRGYAPANLALPVKCTQPILALGGQLKATFALGRAGQAILSHHLGDLDSAAAWEEYQRSIAHFETLFQFVPEMLAHDLHPDYASTRYAAERTGNFRRLGIQHHHAHMASCMAEHGLTEKVIGVTFDGTGYGTDGTIWGGEFLIGDYRQFTRAAHLRCVPMPGGERAIREPWRMALAHLVDAGLDPQILKGVSPAVSKRAEAVMRKGFNAPLTSSCGRFLDAVAALLGLHLKASFEGQAAIALESLASQTDAGETYPFSFAKGVVDTRAIIHAIIEDLQRGDAPTRIARSVHLTIAEMIANVCEQLRADFGIHDVVLSGGVFMNRILLGETTQRLTGRGLKTYTQRLVPPNDGGLCLGQLAIAAATI